MPALKVRLLQPDIAPPAYAHAGDAGLDLRAAAELILPPGERALVPTGIAVELPPGHEAQIRPRSGLAINHGVTMLNAPGTIDEGYRGEISVILINLGEQNFTVERGMRIAQMVVAPVTRVEIEIADALEASERGARGFGSSGVI
ncbi:deoxyuridine 5'-triphosphate nucleotidohydrolase [Clostridia bacterium]|nr:deoxyuridine 5'-triphosphate nucleotidohydrolase [Clostridia bacterium]